MSDFLLITPDGWTEVKNASEWLNRVGTDYILDLTTNRDYNNLSQYIEAEGWIGNNEIISDARMINTGDAWRFWFIP